MIKKELGIPYMGGKRKIADKIVEYICKANPNAKYIYDLFGGGGAISLYALQKRQFNQVFYNEFNTGVVELLKYIRDNGVTDEMYKWVDRETFMKHKNDKSWYGGLLSTCWSFGNNVKKGYLFGKDIEEDKRLLHEVVVNKCLKSLNTLPFKLDNAYLDIEPIDSRRLAIIGYIKKNVGRLDLQQLERLQQLQQLEGLKKLERLEVLQRLQQLERLQISNLSYDEVTIDTPIEETIIYCDPPYKGTGKYQKDIDHELFYEWVKNNPYKVYVSSYEFDLPCVLEIEHRSTLSATNNSKVVIEKLFCNKEESYKELKLF